jgi:type VI secretion system protein ImpH
MLPTERRHFTGVIEQLLQAPQRFGFFQAVRLLDQWLGEASADGKGLSLVHFRNSLSLSFPSGEIEALKLVLRLTEGGPQNTGGVPATAHTIIGAHASARDVAAVSLTPSFMGLLGNSGTLPLFYTETLAQHEAQTKDEAARAFMDVFSHRAVSLFYQAWRKHRLPIQYEADRQNRFLPLVLSLAGMGQKGLRDRLQGDRGGVPDEALAFYAGALQQRTLSAKQLQQVLQGYLNVPVRIDQFVGRWYQLPESGKAHLGVQGGVGGTRPVLGRSAMLGERVWQRDLRMRVVLGPLTNQRFQRFLPGGRGALALKELLTVMGGVSLEYEVQLQLKRDDVKGCALDSLRTPTAGRLGWDTFLQTRPANDDRGDVRYDIHAAA